MNNVYTEAVSSQVNANLRKKGYKSATDNFVQVDGQNVYIDSSSMKYSTDDNYIKDLARVCEKIASYDQKIIYIPVSKWARTESEKPDKMNNPVGCILRYIKSSPTAFKKTFTGFAFVFYNDAGEVFVLRVDMYLSTEYSSLLNLVSKLSTIKPVVISKPTEDEKSPVKDVQTTSTTEEEEKEEKIQDLVDAITMVAQNSESEGEAWEKSDNDELIKKLAIELSEEENNAPPKIDPIRAARMEKLNTEFLNKNINGSTVQDILNKGEEEQAPVKMKVASINEEWNDVQFANFQNRYDINVDILRMLKSLATKSYPVSIMDIKIEDTSDNQDYIDTYTVNMEDSYGKRFNLVFDIPKFKNNRFMRLRGNEKVMSGQLLLLPCIKTDQDTVQCVSNYNKIFIRRKGAVGKTFQLSNRFLKAIRTTKTPMMKVYYGDYTAICIKHDLPVDYIDIASEINRIETPSRIYYFDQDVYYRDYKADRKNGIPYAVNRSDGSVVYFDQKLDDDTAGKIENMLSYRLFSEIGAEVPEFKSTFDDTKVAAGLSYSCASLLSNEIPLAVVIGYSNGLDKMIRKLLKCNYELTDKRTNFDPNKHGMIRFKDGYLIYNLSYTSSMLLNGLAVCPTESYEMADVEKRSMWLDFLDQFGGRLLADGLDNFAELFIDPITEEVCEHFHIPSNYFEMLIHANRLLADNKYNRHTDISGNRYRTNEIVAGYFYNALAKSYADYKSQIKRGRKVGMTMKRSTVIDMIMQDPTSTDLSILNPLLEIEAANSVSFKGLSGMNNARSYGLDKRTFDESMINKIALSTGFAANVGIARQTTIDMDIEGKRGYIKPTNKDDMSVTKSLGMTEAVTPFGTTRDDPFRSAMTFIQTSKHSMRVNKSMPLLITNGADEAMPYITSDTFAYKAKEDGTVTEVTVDHMIVTYSKPVTSDDNMPYYNEYISLKEEVKKNSDGGFYITLKLDTDLKPEDKFKKGDIIAYDRSSFSNKNGETDDLAFNVGVLAKVAILNTDEGFEDSTSISSWLSNAMATDVVVQKEKDLSKNTNVYYMVKIGQELQEGDPLMIFQNSYDEEDANKLLSSITDPDFVSDLGRIKLKSKITGVVQDIKIYRTCELEDMSESLRKIVEAYEKQIKTQKKMYEKYHIPGANLLDPDYKMPATGQMKNNNNGVRIVFYLKYNDKLSVGDKVVAQSANKGVVKNIFPADKTPFSEYRPDEQIHALFAARSFNARMVTSVWVSGAINKCMIELDRQVKEIMGIEWKHIEDYE